MDTFLGTLTLIPYYCILLHCQWHWFRILPMMHCVNCMYVISWEFWGQFSVTFPAWHIFHPHKKHFVYLKVLLSFFFSFLFPIPRQALEHVLISLLHAFASLMTSQNAPFLFKPSPFSFLSNLSSLATVGEGLSASRNSLLKLGGSISNLSQRSDSRVSMLLNHLLPGPGHGTSPGTIPTPQSTPPSSRHFDSTDRTPQAHLEIPEVVVSPPEEDEESEEDVLDLGAGEDKYSCEWWHEQKCSYSSLHCFHQTVFPIIVFSLFYCTHLSMYDAITIVSQCPLVKLSCI